MRPDKTHRDLQVGSLSRRSVTPGRGGCPSRGRGREGALGALASVLAPEGPWAEQAGPDAGEDRGAFLGRRRLSPDDSAAACVACSADPPADGTCPASVSRHRGGDRRPRPTGRRCARSRSSVARGVTRSPCPQRARHSMRERRTEETSHWGRQFCRGGSSSFEGHAKAGGGAGSSTRRQVLEPRGQGPGRKPTASHGARTVPGPGGRPWAADASLPETAHESTDPPPLPAPGAGGGGRSPAARAALTPRSLSALAAATPARCRQDPGWALGNLMLAGAPGSAGSRSSPSCWRIPAPPGPVDRGAAAATGLGPGSPQSHTGPAPPPACWPLPAAALRGMEGFPLALAGCPSVRLSGSPLLPPARRAPRPSQSPTLIGRGVMER